jgi:hypothetical protein
LLGFVPSKGDTSLFVLHNKDVMIYVLVYVDNIIIANSSKVATTALLRALESYFALKDLGELLFSWELK